MFFAWYANRSIFLKNLLQTLFVLVLFFLSFMFYVDAEKKIDTANEVRLHSFMLADELRQSSDDLTRMVRTYAVTRDPIYKKHYQEILDIRNGIKNRPIDYHNIYWDLVSLNDKRPRLFEKDFTPLIERMRQAHFSDEEFQKLEEAKKNSDNLTKTEYLAMEFIEKRASVSKKAKNRELAISILHDEAYHNAKASIMRPIQEFYLLMEKRTATLVDDAIALALFFRIVFIFMGVFFFFMLWRLYKTVNMILGSSIDHLHTQITKIGQGDFSTPIQVNEKTKNSVLGWLGEMQMMLMNLMAYNERLKALYAALSQCNQAIVRSKDEAELFPIICRDAIEFGEMKMAWIGMIDEANNHLKVMSYYGDGSDYLQAIAISLDPSSDASHGPTGRAILDDKPFWCQDFQNSSHTALWHEKGKVYGWKSSAALPLHRNNKVVGVFSLYSQELNAFDEHAKKLLEEMAMDISYALESFQRNREQKKYEERIDYLANFDALTGLPNRIQLNIRSKALLSQAKRYETNIAVMFLDLDHFKDINDSLGHSIGDNLLIQASHRLKSILRDEDIIARLGGDEFIVLLPNIDANGASIVAQKLLELFGSPFKIEHHELNISASIGIALYPEDGVDFETLYKNADTAMYRAKQDGRDLFCFYTQEMQANSKKHLEYSNALHSALQKDQFELYYQPQFSSDGKKIIGAEALLRWKHPEFGFVSPAEFIPIAEENGTILPIGDWVIRTAVNTAKEWIDAGMEPIIMAVNLSAVQFRFTDLHIMIADILSDAKLPAEYLEIELTESVAMQNPQHAINVMNDLHVRGIKMSIDDFGTGYSSLNYLKKFNVYKLKIDKSFIKDIDTDDDDKTIVHTIINMAKNLGLQTIAEGVETLEQLSYLQEQACDEIQGYYFSKPLCKADFESFRSQFS